MIKSLNPNSRINLQVLEKIERNRRNNRDEIKERIKNGGFYRLKFDIPCIKGIDLKEISKLMGGASDGISVVRKACNSVKCILMVGDREVEDFDYNLYLTYKGKVFQSGTIEMKDVVLNVRGTLNKLELRDTTSIWIEDGMTFDKPRYKVLEIEPQKRKCYVKYTQFDNLKNYPNLKIKNETDALSQIIPDYHFTGYTWKCEHTVYDDFRGKDLENEADKYYTTTRYDIDINRNTWKDVGLVYDLDYEGKLIMKYPDKYLGWKFAIKED